MKIYPYLLKDGYKAGHIHQYAKNTEVVFANFTPRATRRDNTETVVFAGLQYFIKEFLIKQWNENFFDKPLKGSLKQFNRVMNSYINPNTIGTSHIEKLHKLGYLPIEIYALPEGTEYPIKVPSLVIWNTIPEFDWVKDWVTGWLTNDLETILSTSIWGMCTSATTAHQYKKILTKYAMITVGNADFVPFQGHDFSFRGMFGLEAACMSGASHLFSFLGTDTIPAIPFLEEYYNADCEKELVGCSVAATEHSVACTNILNFVTKQRTNPENGKLTHDELMNLADIDYVKHLITEVYPTGIVSIVADSFDYWNTITNTARILKDIIMNRDGKVVFRPDTGDPVRVVCGYNDDEILIDGNQIYELIPDAQTGSLKGDEISENERKGSIECLWEIFGGTITATGYRLLDSHVGLIYGDSITLKRADEICFRLMNKNFASINVVFGIGSFTYQYVTRDTDGYAVKATFAVVNGVDLEIYKSPKGKQAQFKKSATGLVAVFKDENNKFYVKDHATWDEVRNCEFVPVFKNSQLLKDYTLAEVRANLAQYV